MAFRLGRLSRFSGLFMRRQGHQPAVSPKSTREKLVFWRDGSGRVSCLRDRCPHRGVELSKGQLVNGHLQCPFHGFEYDASGKVCKIPAYGRNFEVPERFQVSRYATHEAHGFIFIYWGEVGILLWRTENSSADINHLSVE